MHLLAVEKRLAALDREAQPRGLQRVLERLHAREPPREHQHVSRAAWARSAVDGVAHGLAALRDPEQERGESARLGDEQLLAGGVRARGEAQRDDGLPRVEPRRRCDRLVGRLVRLVRGLDQVREHAVDEAEDRGSRAEVLGQVQHPCLGLADEFPEESDLCAAEAVDRLLGVADDHESAGAVAGEEARKLHLKRVGVLELVDHQVAEALLEPHAHARVVAQRVARLDEQVEEVEDAALGLAALVDAHDAGERAHQVPVEVGAERRGPTWLRLLGPRRERAPLGERLGRRPVGLEADVDRDRVEAQEVRELLRTAQEARGLGELRELDEPRREQVALAGLPRKRRAARRLLQELALGRLEIEGVLRG